MFRKAKIVRGHAKVFPAAGAHDSSNIMPFDEEVLRRSDAEGVARDFMLARPLTLCAHDRQLENIADAAPRKWTVFAYAVWHGAKNPVDVLRNVPQPSSKEFCAAR